MVSYQDCSRRIIMRIAILIDNCPSSDNPCLKCEHGLSVYVDCDDVSFLCDMGLTSGYRENASLMGVDLQSVDFAVVSHGHNDHTGGLEDFLRSYAGIPVYLSSDVFNHRYYSTRHGARRDISTQQGLETEHGDRLYFVDSSRWISETIAIVKCESRGFESPRGNCFLMKDDESDDFSHELSIAIKTDDGLVVISSCSHCGAMNIIESCRAFTGEDRVVAFVGGLHFVDDDWTAEEVARFVEDVKTVSPETKFYVGHCTGDRAKRLLSHHPNITIFSTAQEITI